MTTLSAPVTARETAVREVAQLLHSELAAGPEGSGFLETVKIAGLSLDVSASRGWGVYLDRVLPDGAHVTRSLRGDDVALEAIESALNEVLTASAVGDARLAS